MARVIFLFFIIAIGCEKSFSQKSDTVVFDPVHFTKRKFTYDSTQHLSSYKQLIGKWEWRDTSNNVMWTISFMDSSHCLLYVPNETRKLRMQYRLDATFEITHMKVKGNEHEMEWLVKVNGNDTLRMQPYYIDRDWDDKNPFNNIGIYVRKKPQHLH